MSDISIPGVNSRFNTESTIQELLDVESIQLGRLQAQVENYETEKRIWQELNVGLASLRASTRELFSFENPFNERRAISSNENLLKAEANRAAVEGITKIRILQTATADRFISQAISEDRQIEQGVYRFTVGDEAINLRFRGGSVKEFSDSLNRRNPELLRSSVVKNRPGTQVLLIESLKQGATNPIGFEGDAEKLVRDLGWQRESSPRTTELSADLATDRFGKKTPATVVNPAPAEVAISVGSDNLRLAPGEEASLPLPEALADTSGLLLQYELRLTEGEQPLPPSGPSIPDLGSVSFRDVTLPNLPSVFPAPDEVTVDPKGNETNTLIFARAGSSRVPLPDVQDSADFLTVQIPLADYTSRLDSLEIVNSKHAKELTIRNIIVLNPSARDAASAENSLANSRNAIFEVEGILVERENNSVDDVIPGVTLTLGRASDEEIEIRVEPDLELVKDSIIEWVARYNQIIRDTNILTRNNQEIIDEIEYFSDEEREKYGEWLGRFQGDNVLNTLRQRLQNYSAGGYETRAGRNLSLLAQIGISTNASRGGGNINVSRLRGYLEINENVLDQALATRFLAIKDLFGRDGDGDLIVDQGIGYEINRFVQSFVETAGIVASRTSRYDNLIGSYNDDIRDYEEHLEDYEAGLRQQFGAMESAINNLENSSRGLDNLNRNNNNNN